MRVLKVICCATAITLLAASGARADEWNKKTYLTFSGPVQIPGSTLPAGTYMFQLADPDNARHVVMVSSKDGTRIYGMFITIPNDRLQTPDQSVVMFGESPSGTPQAVQAWWYPGDRIGEEFVYPKDQAVRIAKANHREVLATDANVNANGSESDRMASLRGSNIARVDENGTMKGQSSTADKANKPTATSGTAAATTTDRSASATTTTADSKTQRSTATTAPSNTVNGRDTATTTSGRARTNTAAKSTTAGKTGQTSATNTAGSTASTQRANRLPTTASNQTLFELLSALALAGGLALRRLRQSAEAR